MAAAGTPSLAKAVSVQAINAPVRVSFMSGLRLSWDRGPGQCASHTILQATLQIAASQS